MALGVGPSLPIPLTSSVVVVVAAVVAANADNSIVFVVLVVGIIVAALALVNDIVVRNFAREPVQHTTMENNTAAGKQTDRQLLLD